MKARIYGIETLLGRHHFTYSPTAFISTIILNLTAILGAIPGDRVVKYLGIKNTRGDTVFNIAVLHYYPELVTAILSAIPEDKAVEYLRIENGHKETSLDATLLTWPTACPN